MTMGKHQRVKVWNGDSVVALLNPLPVQLALGTSGGRVFSVNPRVAVTFPYNVVNTRLATGVASGTGAAVGGENNMARLQSGTDSDGSARVETIGHVRYVPPSAAYCSVAGVFGTPQASSRQAIGIGNSGDGYGFGYNGTGFGTFVLKNGVFDWTPQADWSVDPMVDGTGPSGYTLNPLFGNAFFIDYQWRGFGAIRYHVEEPTTGMLQLVHVKPYPGTQTTPHSRLGSLPVFAEAVNDGNTTSLDLHVTCLAGGSMGEDASKTDFGLYTTVRKTGITARVAALTIKNNSTFNGLPHGVEISLAELDVLEETSNRDILVELIKDATLGGTPSYTDVDTSTSVVSVDTAGTTVTGGYPVRAFLLQGSASDNIPLKVDDIILAHEETLTVAVTQVSGAGSADVQVVLNWDELW